MQAGFFTYYVQYRLIWLVLFFLLRLFSALPLAILQIVGGAVGIVVYWSSPRYRARLNTNLTSAADLHRFKPQYLKAAISAGMMFGDSLWIWRHQDAVLAKTKIENRDELIYLASNKNGLIVLAPHFGGFEIIPHIFTQEIKTTVMYRPARLSWINQLMTKSRHSSKIQYVPADINGVRLVRRALNNGEVVGIVADQVPSARDGVWATFFNQSAYTTNFPYKLSQKSQAVIIYITAERLALGKGWRFHTQLAKPQPPNDPVFAANEMNNAFEEMILLNPTQYLWSYNRYKNPFGIVTG
ncbi:lysophospholipid acyltransferase family protein [Polynucleobacter brandtiae]|uniref:LpxL/LpxP family acyltransferase n=1 Tax=Polynucleobacter brandtiae TaxID=1938816 RepID=UPI002100861E|nr:lysophospholipid acyltransferase family protein [Polynucleobacter brandtiae]